MKKMIALFLVLCVLLSVFGCGSAAESETSVQEKEPAVQEQTAAEQETAPVEEEIDDEAWDELEALGNVTTENGVLTVSVTLPAELVGEEETQEALDAAAGEGYLSAKLNDDGSVTYQLTKKQHKEMLDGIVEAMEESIGEMVNGEDYSITGVEHNKDFTEFDVSLSGTELGFADSFSSLAFYMFGGFYGLFSGHTPEHVVVNFYDANGDLIESADSADLEE